MNRREKRTGKKFTLIELITVIAIITILTGLLLPTLSRARAKVMASSCAGNLKQIGVAMQFYVDDNLNFLPGYKLIPEAPLQYIGGGEYKYGKTYYHGRLLRCPVDRNPGHYNSLPQWDFNNSYGYNYLYLSNSEVDHWGGIKLLRVRQPSVIVMFADSGTFDWGIAANSMQVITRRVSDNRPISQRHNGGSNILFIDGHVKAYKYDDIAAVSGDEHLENWKE